MNAEIWYYIAGLGCGSLATLCIVWSRRPPAIPTKRRHMKRRASSVELETRPNRRITPSPAQSFDEGNTHQ